MGTRSRGAGEAEERAGRAPDPGGSAPVVARTALPLAPLKGVVIFPGARATLSLSAERVAAAVKAAYATQEVTGNAESAANDAPESAAPARPSKKTRVAVVNANTTKTESKPDATKPDAADEPGARRFVALFQPEGDAEATAATAAPVIGTLVTITQYEEQGEQNVQVSVEGVARARVVEWTQREPYAIVSCEIINDPEDSLAAGESPHQPCQQALREAGDARPPLQSR